MMTERTLTFDFESRDEAMAFTKGIHLADVLGEERHALRFTCTVIPAVFEPPQPWRVVVVVRDSPSAHDA